MRGSSLGELLRRYRRDRGLTQEELAERSGVSVAAISLLERGRTHVAQRFTVHALSAALGLADEDAEAFAEAARRVLPNDEAPSEAAAPGVVSRHGDLPIPLTPLIGRGREVEALLALLAEPSTRLLTLTGPAGAGKTRLGQHVAAAQRDDAHHDVVWIGLIPVQEPERVLATVAQAVGLRDQGAIPLREALVDALRERHCLLVLDNFEQVLPAARGLLEVLVACPGVQALVTSRAPLNVRGERCFPVAPLELPDAAQLASLDELRRAPAVALFLERVTASLPAFTVDTLETGWLVAEICAHLDGLPLAIELAAARVRHLGLRQLHERVAHPALLSTLTEGPRDLAEHQRTMRSTIAWSYDLLGATEQRLFRWIGAFVGGATFAALLAVSDLAEEQVSTALATLTDANLVRCLDDGSVPHYTQLVTLRAYAQEQLREHGEWEEACRRHAAYFADFVDALAQNAGTRPEDIMAQVDRDYENVRAALAWVFQSDANAVGLRMVGALRRFWAARSQFVEGLEWLERFLARADTPTTDNERAALADAWTGVMVICHRQDRFERARAAGEMALALQREIGDVPLIAGALMNVANPITQLHDFDRAAALLEECLSLLRQTGNREGMVFPVMNLGCLYYDMREPRRALEYYEQSLTLSFELGETEWARALTWCNVGEAHVVLDEPDRAVEVTKPAYDLFVRQHDLYGAATCAFTLGRALWRLTDGEQAKQYLSESEQLYRTIDNRALAARALCVRASVALDGGDLTAAQSDLVKACTDLTALSRTAGLPWWLLERVAAYACQRGQRRAAAQLLGAATQLWEAAPAPVDPSEHNQRAHMLAALHGALDEPEVDELMCEGRALAGDGVVRTVRRVVYSPT